MRRPRRTGTVEQVKGGKWRFRCVDGAGGRFTSPAEWVSRDEALKFLELFKQKILSGEFVVPPKKTAPDAPPVEPMTLAWYWQKKFIPRMEKLVAQGIRRKGTLQSYRNKWPRIDAGLGSLALQEITRRTVTHWAEGLRGEVTRPDSFVAAVKTILQQAVSVDFLLEGNPASDVAIEIARTDDDERRPTPDEAEALLNCQAIPREERLIMAFALGAGLRPGEWRNLELVDVHLDAAVPEVFVQYGTNDRGPTKTGKKRRVPVLGIALLAMREWLTILPTFAPVNPRGLVFPTASGVPRNEGHPFGRRRTGDRERGRKESLWHAYVEAAGISRRLTPHGLRHGCATELLTGSRGVKLDLWQVQAVLGHDRVTTTQRYLHHGGDDLIESLTPAGTKARVRSTGLFPESTEKGEAPEPLELQRFRGLARVMPRRGIEGAEDEPISPESPVEGLLTPESVLGGLNGGLNSVAAEVLRRAVAGEWPTRQAALELGRQARLEREAIDPVLRAARRLEASGDTWRAALVDLLDLLVPDVEQAKTESDVP